jgi:hypothetical protein
MTDKKVLEDLSVEDIEAVQFMLREVLTNLVSAKQEKEIIIPIASLDSVDKGIFLQMEVVNVDGGPAFRFFTQEV